MNPTGWMLTAAGLLVLGLLAWPSQPAGGGWFAAYRRPSRSGLWGTALPSLAAGGVAAWRVGVLTGLAVALLMGVCATTARVMSASRREVSRTEAMSRLAAVLANQAMVSSTVAEALSRSAPLVTGPVGQAAARMAEECAAGDVPAAAEAFVRAVPCAPAEWLADIVAITAAGGGRVGDALSVLEIRTGEHAATVRLFHAKVAALLPQLIAVVALGAGMVMAVAVAAADVGTWLAGPQGQLLTLLSSGLTVLLAARVLLPAWKGVN